jgi:glycosyltransferase involved in cell wall biosynthesis
MKILVVLPRFPWPLDKGDKLRAYHQVVELSKRHEIYLFAVSHRRVEPERVKVLEPFCRQIRVVHLNRFVCGFNILRNWLSSKSLQMGYWNTKRSKRACKIFAREVKPDVVYSQMVRTMPLVARLPYPKVMDFQDALSMNTERRMEHSKGLWHYLLHFEFKMLRSSEYKAFSIFDALTIISEVDSEAIPHKKNGEIHIVPNGVDFDYFSSQNVKKSGSLNEGGYSICFCGNMSYAPNVDAARYLVKEVMPLVWEYSPYATVLIAGADPKPAVRALASNAQKPEKVTVSGRMPDIREAYASSQLFVAPMRIGSGLQNKLLEAMAMQKQCVTTSLANAALGATSGDQLFVGDSKEDLAYWISLLLGSEEVRSRIAHEGNLFVRQHYSWQAAVQPLENIFNAVRSK